VTQRGRAGRVTPVQDPEAIAVHERVVVMKIVVLYRCRKAVAGKLAAELREARPEPAELLRLGLIQRKLRSDKAVVQLGPPIERSVGHGRWHDRIAL
jgi:hypothetical protein